MTGLLKQFGVAALYMLLIHMDHRFFESDALVSSFEVESGFALAVLLIGGKRYAGGVFLGAILINIMAVPFREAAIISSGSVLEALGGAWLLTRGDRPDLAMQSLRGYLRLLLLGGVAGVSIATGIGALALLVSGFIAPEAFFHELVHWWTGDMLGILLITPLILVCWHARNERLGAKQMAETALLLGLTFLAGQTVFLGWFHSDSLDNIARGYLMFLFIIWVAVRLGRRGVVIALTMVATQAMLGAHLGVGYFANDIAQTQLANYWLYTVVLSVVGMALSTFLAGRKQAEDTLRRSETKFHTLYDSNTDGVHLLDETGFIDCNKATLAMCGCATKEEFCSKSPVVFSPPEQPCGTSSMILANEYIATARERGSHRFEWVGKRLDNGKLFNMDVQLTAMELDGKPVFLVVARDITEKKRTEEELKRFFDLVPDMVCIASTDGHFKKINRAWQTMLGYTEQEILATPFLDFIHPDDRDTTMKEVERQLAGKATIQFSNRYRCKDGSYKWLEWDATPAVDNTLLFASARDITERRESEELLRQNKEKLRAYLDNISDTIWLIDTDLNIAYVSSGVTRLLGVLPEELVGRPSAAVIHPDDMGVIADAQRYVMEHPGEPRTVQYRVSHKDGRWISVESTGVNMLGNPAINGVLITMRDISERKLAEVAIRASEARLQEIIDTMPVALFIKDPVSNIMLMNRACEEQWGMSFSDLRGTDASRFFPPEQMALFLAKDKEVFANRRLVDFEETAWNAALGENRTVHTYKKPVFDETGNPLYLIGMSIDITESKRTNEVLEQAKLIIDNTIDGFWMADMAGNLQGANAAYAKMSGYSVDELTGIHISQLEAKEKSREEVKAHAEKIIAQGFDKFETRHRRKDGREIDLEISVNFMPEAQRFFVFLRDITERKTAEQQLRNLAAHILDVREEEKTRIAREIHDELGSVLTALNMDAYWLSCKLPLYGNTKALLERVVSMMQRIDSAVNATRHIIDDMRPAVLDDLGLLAAIEWLAEDFRLHTGIECRVSCIEDEANLDEHRSIALFRILQEALTNVLRHSGASRVEIEFLHNENETILTVSDNGRGIPENHISASKSYGMLGMAERAGQLGGKIVFGSPQGGGFSVKVTLPLHPGEWSIR
ncbi:MAG TPA: PAS domain S-box protein [Gallionella sp.]|nr:PAS domain S-box protein [Gallionella sp.]